MTGLRLWAYAGVAAALVIAVVFGLLMLFVHPASASVDRIYAGCNVTALAVNDREVAYVCDSLSPLRFLEWLFSCGLRIVERSNELHEKTR
jgi:hypothetical protein